MKFKQLARIGLAIAATSSPLLALSTTSGATGQSYSTTSTMSWGNPNIPTAAQLPAEGDAYSVAFSKNYVYAWMHNGSMSGRQHSAIDCYERATGQECPNYPLQLDATTDPTYGDIQGDSTMYFDSVNKHLYALAGAYDGTNSVAGLVNVDVSGSTPTLTSFTPIGTATLTTVSENMGSTITDGKLYYYTGGASSSADPTAAGTVICYDVAAMTACPHPQINLQSLSPTSAPDAGFSGVKISFVSTHMFYGNSNGDIYCVDLTAATACNFGGTFSATGATLPTDPNLNGPADQLDTAVIPYLDASGTDTGFCYYGNSGAVCKSWTGATLTATSGINDFLNPGLQTWDDGSTFYAMPNGATWEPGSVSGSRIYASDGAGNSKALCYDFATAATCANYPVQLNNPGLTYYISPDPQYPGCNWSIADGLGGTFNGNPTIKLQAFNAITGATDCSGLTTEAPMATFTNGCAVTTAGVLHISAPATVSGTVTVKNAAGTNLHAPFTLSHNSVDLTPAHATSTAVILFHITSPANTRSITADLHWGGPSCAAMVTPHNSSGPQLRVYFAYDVRTLSSAEAAKVMTFARALHAAHIDSVLLTGYTDSKGTVAYNAKLSADRAKAVAALLRADLASLHVTGITVTTAAAGIRTTDATHALNRTVIATTHTMPA